MPQAGRRGGGRFALGGGCEIAMMCDIVIAADNARFGQPEINLGTMPGAGGTQRLPRFIGKAKAMDLCLTGRMMDAAEAERAGLVSRIVPAAKLTGGGGQIAERIAEMSRPIAMMVKESVNRAYRDEFAEGRAVRAPAVPLDLRHRRPQGRHGRLYRKAQTGVPQPLIGSSGSSWPGLTRPSMPSATRNAAGARIKAQDDLEWHHQK